MIFKNFGTPFAIRKKVKNLSINKRSGDMSGEKKKFSRKSKKNRKKNQIVLWIQGEEEEKSVHSTEYEKRMRDHQLSFQRGCADQLQIFVTVLFYFILLFFLKKFIIKF